MTIQTNKNEELVEIILQYELPVYIPTTDKNGELTFRCKDISPEHDFKVKVPAYATESVEALTEYLQGEYEAWGCDMHTIQNPNIYDEKADDFRFEFQTSGINYDY